MARTWFKNQALARTTLASTSYADQVSLTFSPEASTEYFLLGSMVLDYSSTSSDVRGRLNDDTAAAALANVNIEPKDTTDLYPWGLVHRWTSGGSPPAQTFSLEFSGESAGATAGAQSATLIALRRGGSDEFSEDIANTAISTSTPGTKVTLGFSPSDTADWLIIAYAEVNRTDDGTATIELAVDGAPYGTAIIYAKDTSNYYAYSTAGVFSLNASAHVIDLNYTRGGVGTLNIRNASILALRMDSFGAAAHDYSAARQTTSSTTPQAGASVSVTTIAEDHIVIGAGMMDSASVPKNQSAEAALDIAGAPRSISRREAVDVAARMPYLAFDYFGASAGSTSVATTYKATTFDAAGITGAFVALLRVYEAPPPTTYEESVSEALAFSHMLGAQALFEGAVAEALGIADTVAAGKLISESVAEALGLTDASAGSLVIGTSVAESLGIADAEAAQAVFGAAISEALDASDAPAATAIMGAAVTETAALADTASGGLMLLESLSEALGVSDAVATALTIPAAISEALTLTDAAAALATFNPSIAEALGLADTQAGALTIREAITEALALTDAARAGKMIAEAITEALAVTDTAAAQAAMQAAIAEMVSLTDAAQTQAVFTAVLNEHITVADFMRGGREINEAIAEAFGVSDAVAAAIQTIVILTGMLRVRPALGGEVETRARIAATATRLRASLAGKVNIGD